MRLWSIHPKYLDSKGIVALWREALLAQKVLAGETKGYKYHPQLDRFKQTPNSLAAIAGYLQFIVQEADNRGYRFNKDKIYNQKNNFKISVTTGQVEYEFQHLLKKLEVRDPKKYSENMIISEIDVHPLFEVVCGGVEDWEVVR